MSPLLLRNRQADVAINVPRLRRLIRTWLVELLELHEFDLGILLVSEREITALNESFLRHAGPTDVITFNYAPAPAATRLHGEIVLCPKVAVLQARRYRTTWPAEMVRYVVHGVLHLQGFNDQTAADRRRMKRQENRWLQQLTRKFSLAELARPEP